MGWPLCEARNASACREVRLALDIRDPRTLLRFDMLFETSHEQPCCGSDQDKCQKDVHNRYSHECCIAAITDRFRFGFHMAPCTKRSAGNYHFALSGKVRKSLALLRISLSIVLDI